MKKRILSLLLICALLITCMPAALAANISQRGEFIRKANENLFLALSDGEKDVLYSIPTGGGDLSALETSDDISCLTFDGATAYYLRLDGALFQIVTRAEGDEEGVVIVEFTENDVVDNLTLYDGLLYCLVNNTLTQVDPETGDTSVVSEMPMTEYAIAEDVIFFVSSDNQRTYERLVTTTNETLSETAGTLWSMSIFGENPEILLDEGVADLKAAGSSLYFHNLSDNYPMGNTEEMWLEGQLYRYDINEGLSTSMGLDYDWEFYPTDSGVVVYTSQDVSLYPANGGTATKLLAPELRTGLTAYDNTCYVYEYTDRRLTEIPLDGGEAIILYENGSVLNPMGEEVDPYDITLEGTDEFAAEDETEEGTEGAAGSAEQTGIVAEINEAAQAASDSADGYIFPDSSDRKLTRSDVLAISKDLWAYARNEIYAKHGYEFKNGKYSEYFGKKNWYQKGGFSTKLLNSTEWFNMDLIKKMEQEYGLLEGKSVTTATNSSSTSSSSKAKNNYYIFPNSSKKKLTKAQILKVDKSKWALARNEIYARHGYSFKNATYRKYFKNQKWYKEGGFSTKKLNSIEWYNMELIKKMEKKYK